MPAYKQKCIRCKKNYVLVHSRRQVPVCVECGMKDTKVEITDPKFKKLFDIDEKLYEESSFLRNIRANYNRFGELSERQIDAFERVVEELKNPDLKNHKTIYLLRHGESEANARGEIPEPKTPLTQKGKEQAFAHVHYLQDRGVQLLYSSSAERAMQTAKLMGEQLRLSVNRRAMLKDLDMKAWKGRSFDDKDAADAMERRKSEEAADDIETYGMLKERLAPFVDKILAAPQRTIAVVSHVDVTRMLLSLLTGKSVEQCAEAAQPNECIYIVDTKEKRARHFYKGKETDGFLHKV